MSKYSIPLALTYFKERREHYIIGELAKILGYSNKQINELIEHLMDQGYIAYNDNLLAITSRGIRFLILNNLDAICLQAESIETPRINPQKALAIDAPYVPVRFSKKTNR